MCRVNNDIWITNVDFERWTLKHVGHPELCSLQRPKQHTYWYLLYFVPVGALERPA